MRLDLLGSWIYRGLAGLTNAYRTTVPVLLRYRWKVVSAAGLLFVSSLWLIGILKKEFIPAQDQSVFIVQISDTGWILNQIYGL